MPGQWEFQAHRDRHGPRFRGAGGDVHATDDATVQFF